MKDFIHTGFHKPTLTTVDDPHLKVIETDNGLNWHLKFYCGNELIDLINLENPKGSPIHEDVKQLPVHDDEGNYLGTVEERNMNAIRVYLPEPLD